MPISYRTWRESMCVTTIDFRRGDKFPSLVLLGACPGRLESEADPKRPFAGQAGCNLKALLKCLRDLPDKGNWGLADDDFATDVLDDYTLMNSHPAAKWNKPGQKNSGQHLPWVRSTLEKISCGLRTNCKL